MKPLLAMIQPLAMQHDVDVVGENFCNTVALFPCRAKPVGVLAAAEEARAMARREGCGLVEKEQFGPAAPAHHLAPASPEFADASEPRPARPAPRQRFGGGIVNDAAIAGEHPAMRRGDDVAGRRDAVLQGHMLTCSLAPLLRGEGRGEGLLPQTPNARRVPLTRIFRCAQNPTSPRKRGEARNFTPRRRGSGAGTTARYPRERRSRCPATLR